jgi:hypothetical protein
MPSPKRVGGATAVSKGRPGGGYDINSLRLSVSWNPSRGADRTQPAPKTWTCSSVNAIFSSE